MKRALTEIIRPGLKFLAQNSGLPVASLAAEQLMFGTAMAESRCQHLFQMRGPARSIFQVEPESARDLYKHFLTFPRQEKLCKAVEDMSVRGFPIDQQLASNQFYALAIARCLYYRQPEALPAADDFEGLGLYWKKYYNTVYGAGDPSKFTRLLEEHWVSHEN